MAGIESVARTRIHRSLHRRQHSKASAWINSNEQADAKTTRSEKETNRMMLSLKGHLSLLLVAMSVYTPPIWAAPSPPGAAGMFGMSPPVGSAGAGTSGPGMEAVMAHRVSTSSLMRSRGSYDNLRHLSTSSAGGASIAASSRDNISELDSMSDLSTPRSDHVPVFRADPLTGQVTLISGGADGPGSSNGGGMGGRVASLESLDAWRSRFSSTEDVRRVRSVDDLSRLARFGSELRPSVAANLARSPPTHLHSPISPGSRTPSNLHAAQVPDSRAPPHFSAQVPDSRVPSHFPTHVSNSRAPPRAPSSPLNAIVPFLRSRALPEVEPRSLSSSLPRTSLDLPRFRVELETAEATEQQPPSVGFGYFDPNPQLDAITKYQHDNMPPLDDLSDSFINSMELDASPGFPVAKESTPANSRRSSGEIQDPDHFAELEESVRTILRRVRFLRERNRGQEGLSSRVIDPTQESSHESMMTAIGDLIRRHPSVNDLKLAFENARAEFSWETLDQSKRMLSSALTYHQFMHTIHLHDAFFNAQLWQLDVHVPSISVMLASAAVAQQLVAQALYIVQHEDYSRAVIRFVARHVFRSKFGAYKMLRKAGDRLRGKQREVDVAAGMTSAMFTVEDVTGGSSNVVHLTMSVLDGLKGLTTVAKEKVAPLHDAISQNHLPITVAFTAVNMVLQMVDAPTEARDDEFALLMSFSVRAADLLQQIRDVTMT